MEHNGGSPWQSGDARAGAEGIRSRRDRHPFIVEGQAPPEGIELPAGMSLANETTALTRTPCCLPLPASSGRL